MNNPIKNVSTTLTDAGEEGTEVGYPRGRNGEVYRESAKGES